MDKYKERANKISKMFIKQSLIHFEKIADKYTPKETLYYPIKMDRKYEVYLNEYAPEHSEYDSICEDCKNQATKDLNDICKNESYYIKYNIDHSPEYEYFCSCGICSEMIDAYIYFTFANEELDTFINLDNIELLETINNPYDAYKIKEMFISDSCFEKHSEKMYLLADKIIKLFE